MNKIYYRDIDTIMNKIYYSDIDTAKTNTFEQLHRKMDRGITHDDMMLVMNELTEFTSELMYDGEYEDDGYEVEEAYSKVLTVMEDRLDALDDMPSDTVMNKDEVTTIVENLMETIRFM